MIILDFILWLLWAICLMAFSEYFIHRYSMHRRLFPRGWFDWVFEEHAIAHHKHEDYTKNIDLPLYFHLILGAPLLILLYYLAPLGLLATLVVFSYHSYMWTHAHRAIHGLEQNWLQNFQFYRNMEEHHINHHKYTNKNFGVVFLWTDKLLGTKI